MNAFTSPGFWLVFGAVLGVSILAMAGHERKKRRRPTQHRGVQPHEQAKLIIADLGADGFDTNVNHAYHMTTDPQAYAKAFVPSDHKD